MAGEAAHHIITIYSSIITIKTDFKLEVLSIKLAPQPSPGHATDEFNFLPEKLGRFFFWAAQSSIVLQLGRRSKMPFFVLYDCHLYITSLAKA
jgi:hypothetical protein